MIKVHFIIITLNLLLTALPMKKSALFILLIYTRKYTSYLREKGHLLVLSQFKTSQLHKVKPESNLTVVNVLVSW